MPDIMIDRLTEALNHHHVRGSRCMGRKCPYYTTGCLSTLAGDALAVINAQRETLEAIDRYVRELDEAVNGRVENDGVDPSGRFAASSPEGR